MADAYDDCILQNMKGATSEKAALEIKNACISKYHKVIELSDISFIEGYASYVAPGLQVTINNKSDIPIVSITVEIRNKKSGIVSNYDIANLNGFPPRKITDGWVRIGEQTLEPQNFFKEHEWRIVRATGFEQSLVGTRSLSCTQDEYNDHFGDCWVKLSYQDKLLLVSAFNTGWITSYTHVEHQLPGWKRELEIQHNAVDMEKQFSFFEKLYTAPANRVISLADANDLAIRQWVHPKTKDIGPLTEMYRGHHRPLFSGYLRGFLPPNKVIISRWNDWTAKDVGGNETQTITLLGVAATGAEPRLQAFMGALLNITNCRSMIKTSDAYKYFSYGTDQEQEANKRMYEAGATTQVEVRVQYPEFRRHLIGELFNERGELSGEIFLNPEQVICYRPVGTTANPVNLADLMLSDPTKRAAFALSAISFNAPINSISLNEYLIGNHLAKRDFAKSDPRELPYLHERDTPNNPFEPEPSDEGVAKVLAAGAAN